MIAAETTRLNTNTRFLKLWVSTGLSNLADGMTLTAGPLLAASITQNPVEVAGLASAQRLPWFLFVLFSGVIVDRFDRRAVMVGANGLRAAMLLLLAVATLGNWASLIVLYTAFFFVGVAETLADNAAFALLPALVKKHQIESANGRLFSTQTIANEFAGQSLGGLLFALLRALPFFVSGIAFGLAGAAIAIIATPANQPETPAERESVWESLRGGVRWFWGNKLIRTMALMAAVLNLGFNMTAGVFVLFAQNLLGLTEAQYGLMLASGAVGGVMAAFLTDRMVKRFGAARFITIDILVNILAFALIGVAQHPAVVVAAFILMSFINTAGNIVVISIRQNAIPGPMLGRVTSVYRLIALGVAPIGSLLGGIIAQVTDNLRAPFLVAIVITLLFIPYFTHNITPEAIKAQEQENRNA